MARIINRNNIDNTVRIFDQFYEVDVIINSSEYDIVFGFLRNVCETKRIAENFTVLLFRIAQQTDTSVLDLVANLKKVNSNRLTMNRTIAYYLNSFTNKNTQFGVAQVPQPNRPAARNVLQ